MSGYFEREVVPVCQQQYVFTPKELYRPIKKDKYAQRKTWWLFLAMHDHLPKELICYVIDFYRACKVELFFVSPPLIVTGRICYDNPHFGLSFMDKCSSLEDVYNKLIEYKKLKLYSHNQIEKHTNFVFIRFKATCYCLDLYNDTLILCFREQILTIHKKEIFNLK